MNSIVWGVSCAGVAVDRSSFSPAGVSRKYSIEIEKYTNRERENRTVEEGCQAICGVIEAVGGCSSYEGMAAVVRCSMECEVIREVE